MKKRINIILLSILIIIINIGCDQGTKEYARNNFKEKGVIEVIDNLFIINYVENSGGFLSLGSNIPQPYKKIILTVFPLLVLIGMLIYLGIDKKLTMVQIICLSSIVGGGFSNIYDRIVYNGLVTDFLNFGIGNIRTGILNFADMSITFGALLFLIFQYVQEKNIKGVTGS